MASCPPMSGSTRGRRAGGHPDAALAAQAYRAALYDRAVRVFAVVEEADRLARQRFAQRLCVLIAFPGDRGILELGVLGAELAGLAGHACLLTSQCSLSKQVFTSMRHPAAWTKRPRKR